MSAVPSPSRIALFDLGFRPFYLLASIFSAASVLLWTAQASGHLSFGYLKGAAWHGHEMLFGYAIAVIAGFLLTAVRAWTNQSTAAGWPLGALALLWICGRVAILTPFALTAAVVNAAFPLALAAAIGMPLWRAGNRRNLFFVGLLVVMAVLVLAVHLAAQGRIALPPRFGLQLGLDIVLFMLAVIGGRVIPMFTNNGVRGAHATRHPAVEKAALGSIVVLFLADLGQAPAALVAVIAAIAALAHGARLALWNSWLTRGTPLVWILHAAYAWIVVHLVLRGLDAADIVAAPFATHALTAGAIGGMTLGMMTRTARGHTGRPLIADKFETAMFVLVQAAALVRVFGGLLLPAAYLPSLEFSGVLWAAAFALYAVRYWSVLTRARIDGKPG